MLTLHVSRGTLGGDARMWKCMKGMRNQEWSYTRVRERERERESPRRLPGDYPESLPKAPHRFSQRRPKGPPKAPRRLPNGSRKTIRKLLWDQSLSLLKGAGFPDRCRSMVGAMLSDYRCVSLSRLLVHFLMAGSGIMYEVCIT